MRSSLHSYRSSQAVPPALNHIAFKKPGFPVGPGLDRYLARHGRSMTLPVGYNDLLRFESLLAHQGPDGHETLWTTVLLRPADQEDLHERLVELYRILTSDGKPLPYLRVASIDFCSFGNSQPFRIRILNQLNDNYDHYYIKKADASRVYGLELEHLLSPNRINYVVDGDTMVEEHIIGIPGDDFVKDPRRYGGNFNPVRLCKEFVKFNERCFVRLLGDMRAYNFIVDVMQDFDQVQYRLRSIDFDQQSFEGRHRIYLPQYYKENLPFVQLARKHISMETAEQYAEEERSLLRKRYLLAADRMAELLEAMQEQDISLPEHVATLRGELADYHGIPAFKQCAGMADILRLQMKVMLEL